MLTSSISAKTRKSIEEMSSEDSLVFLIASVLRSYPKHLVEKCRKVQRHASSKQTKLQVARQRTSGKKKEKEKNAVAILGISKDGYQPAPTPFALCNQSGRDECRECSHVSVLPFSAGVRILNRV